MTRKKKTPKQKLFNEAYEAMRDFIRKRDANFQGYITCCSSGKIIPLEDAQLTTEYFFANIEEVLTFGHKARLL